MRSVAFKSEFMCDLYSETNARLHGCHLRMSRALQNDVFLRGKWVTKWDELGSFLNVVLLRTETSMCLQSGKVPSDHGVRVQHDSLAWYDLDCKICTLTRFQSTVPLPLHKKPLHANGACFSIDKSGFIDPSHSRILRDIFLAEQMT